MRVNNVPKSLTSYSTAKRYQEYSFQSHLSKFKLFLHFNVRGKNHDPNAHNQKVIKIPEQHKRSKQSIVVKLLDFIIRVVLPQLEKRLLVYLQKLILVIGRVKRSRVDEHSDVDYDVEERKGVRQKVRHECQSNHL